MRLSEHSEPQPDVALLKAREDFYAESYPGPADIVLLVEVADTSGHIDRDIKLPLYAKARIPEVWIVNLVNNRVEVYREPADTGYRSVTEYQRVDQLRMQAFPGLTLPVIAILS